MVEIPGAAVLVTVKLCRMTLVVPWDASRVTTPGDVGVTVNTPLTGPLMVALPVEPLATVSVSGSPELAVGWTVKAPDETACASMAAKVIVCAVAASVPAT